MVIFNSYVKLPEGTGGLVTGAIEDDARYIRHVDNEDGRNGRNLAMGSDRRAGTAADSEAMGKTWNQPSHIFGRKHAI